MQIHSVFIAGGTADDGIFPVTTDEEGDLVFIFYSKQEGARLLFEHRDGVDATRYMDIQNSIRESSAPQQSERDTVCIRAGAATTLVKALNVLGSHTGQVRPQPPGNYVWSFQTPSTVQQALHVVDGIYAIQRGTQYHVFVLYSRGDARKVFREYCSLAEQAHNEKVLRTSPWPETSDQETVHLTGTVALTICQALWLESELRAKS